MTSRQKIAVQHLARPAMVYIRQSTLDQVRHNHESRRRQYHLAEHARALGWKEVIVVDDDMGKSGATAAGRTGFQRLVAEVSLGKVGAVLSIEVSRLARNNRDWYQLLDLCALMDTLIIDGEGIYDVRQGNDRLLLGLKGTLSEAELSWFRQRAQAGLLAKAQRGELILGLPVGYVKTLDGKIEKHPNLRVRDAVELVFRKFLDLGSARQVLLYFRHNKIRLPALSDTARQVLSWQVPVYQTIIKFLHNPIYAGAYAFGRTETRTSVIDGMAHKVRGHQRQLKEWTVLLHDHHEGYIGWEDYERNQKLLAENAQMKGLMVRGAPREGSSLLAGLLRCARCGRKLHVAYSGANRQVPRYHCRGAALNHGGDFCISFGGHRVDEAVEREVIAVLTPGAIDAALKSATDTAAEHNELERVVALELEQARYEAERARRQYDAVEPENRLVAATLESRWNATLQRAEELHGRLEALRTDNKNHRLPDRATLLELAERFEKVWHHPATDYRTKKRLIRLLIKEIVVSVQDAESSVELLIHWEGGKHSQLRVPKNRPGQHRRCTDREVIEVVRDLARSLPDAQIARVLNRLGYQTGANNSFTQQRVTTLRNTHGIAVFDSKRVPITLTIEKAAALLGVSTATVRRMIESGTIEAKQPVPYAPWAIDPEALSREDVKQAVDAVKSGGKLPRTVPEQQLTLIKSGT
jgi:DNA invertase Pin-like site-specific DNA recombinase